MTSSDIAETRSATGKSSLRGHNGNRDFGHAHTHFMLQSAVRRAEYREDVRQDRKARGLSNQRDMWTTRYQEVIARFWKCGVYTKLGTTRRDLDPAEICPKLKIINDLVLAEKLAREDFGFYISLIRCYSKRHYRHLKTPVMLSWYAVTRINAIIKKYPEAPCELA